MLCLKYPVLAFQACVSEHKDTASTAGVAVHLTVTWTWSGLTSSTHGFRSLLNGHSSPVAGTGDPPASTLACWEAQSTIGGTQADSENDKEKSHSIYRLLEAITGSPQLHPVHFGDLLLGPQPALSPCLCRQCVQEAWWGMRGGRWGLLPISTSRRQRGPHPSS